MTGASPRPWSVGNQIKRLIFGQGLTDPQDALVGVMDTAADAALVVAAVNAYGEPTTIEADLRKGWHESERRRRIAAVVAAHHRECLVDGGRLVGQDRVEAALDAVLAALNGSTDPARLRIAGHQLVEDKVLGVIASTGGEVAGG